MKLFTFSRRRFVPIPRHDVGLSSGQDVTVRRYAPSRRRYLRFFFRLLSSLRFFFVRSEIFGLVPRRSPLNRSRGFLVPRVSSFFRSTPTSLSSTCRREIETAAISTRTFCPSMNVCPVVTPVRRTLYSSI